MRAPLTLAVAQPACVVGDPDGNAVRHAEAVRASTARVVVFPELSLTGYDLAASAIDPHGAVLESIVDACGACGSIALVGAPVADSKGREFIATLRVSGQGVDVIYRKMCLGGNEPRRFSAGGEPVTVVAGGWRLGLGICKDTGMAEHVDAIAALEPDVYVAGLVHRPEELEEQETRARRIAHRTRAYVAFASFAGSTGEGYHRTAGRSAVWSPTGQVLARASARPGDIVCATVC